MESIGDNVGESGVLDISRRSLDSIEGVDKSIAVCYNENGIHWR
ncbi:MAG: hypothetical protein DDT26_01434 [Dehalococcoidia bacterium]|nr:hypothetical protein [Chloroflexota bacterium]